MYIYTQGYVLQSLVCMCTQGGEGLSRLYVMRINRYQTNNHIDSIHGPKILATPSRVYRFSTKTSRMAGGKTSGVISKKVGDYNRRVVDRGQWITGLLGSRGFISFPN